jgi:FdhD protein
LKPLPSNTSSSFPRKRDSGFRGNDDLKNVMAVGKLNGAPSTWALPEEVPVAILLNSISYTVMMATPADLEDFALGFVLSEGLVAHHTHVRNVLVLKQDEGFSVDVSIPVDKLLRERMVSRSMDGRVGCGLCGIAEIEDAVRMPQGKVRPVGFSNAAIALAFAALPQHQPMNAVNRTVHAAAFCAVDGAILLSREDVGRHNALDKLIGAMARKGVTPEQGFVLMSSRCSFELVQKCAHVGLGALATISAPTALALELARQAGLQLAAMAKDGVMIFDGVEDGTG